LPLWFDIPPSNVRADPRGKRGGRRAALWARSGNVGSERAAQLIAGVRTMPIAAL
jgi:hypothetical protein